MSLVRITLPGNGVYDLDTVFFAPFDEEAYYCRSWTWWNKNKNESYSEFLFRGEYLL